MGLSRHRRTERIPKATLIRRPVARRKLGCHKPPSATTRSAYLVTPGTFDSRMVEPDAVATMGRTLSIACRIVPSYGSGSSG
jgi:hypothetical protein